VEAIVEIMSSRAGFLVGMAVCLGLFLGWYIWGRKLAAYEELIDDINVDRSERTRRANSLEVELTSQQARFDRQIAMRNRQLAELQSALPEAQTRIAQLQRELVFHQTQVAKMNEKLEQGLHDDRVDLSEWKKAVRNRDTYIKRLEAQLSVQLADQNEKKTLAQTA